MPYPRSNGAETLLAPLGSSKVGNRIQLTAAALLIVTWLSLFPGADPLPSFPGVRCPFSQGHADKIQLLLCERPGVAILVWRLISAAGGCGLFPGANVWPLSGL